MGRVSTANHPVAAAQKKLLKLTRKRLERFVTLLPKFLVNDDPDTIHDLRVWSRRLQQALRPILESKTSGGRKVIRALRRVRQALGDCRNLDVNCELARSRAHKAESVAIRDGWSALAAYLQESREPLVTAARKEISKHDLVAFIDRARELIAEADSDVDPTAKLEAALADSIGEWDQGFRLAVETRIDETLHTLRIATKRLRYRAELLADSGSAALAPMLKDLKEIQTALGDWHDRSMLLQCAAEFLARPDFLAQHPDQAGAMLAEMEKEKQANEEATENVLQRAAKLRKHWREPQVRHEPPSGTN
jgi:CHAD domain-containing protein